MVHGVLWCLLVYGYHLFTQGVYAWVLCKIRARVCVCVCMCVVGFIFLLAQFLSRTNEWEQVRSRPAEKNTKQSIQIQFRTEQSKQYTIAKLKEFKYLEIKVHQNRNEWTKYTEMKMRKCQNNNNNISTRKQMLVLSIITFIMTWRAQKKNVHYYYFIVLIVTIAIVIWGDR